MGHLARMQTLPHDKTYFNRVINSYSEILSEKENTITFLQTWKISGHRFGSHFVQFTIMLPLQNTLLTELQPNSTFTTPQLIDCPDKWIISSRASCYNSLLLPYQALKQI